MSAPILVPTLGESVTEATVAKWLKKSGDTVNEDEQIIELETDKVSVEVTSPKTGVITEITVQEGQTVEVGAQLGLIGESGANVATQPEESEKPKIEKIEVEQEIKPEPKTSKPEPEMKDPNKVVFVEFKTFVGKNRKRKKVERITVTSAELSEMLEKDKKSSAQLSLFG